MRRRFSIVRPIVRLMAALLPLALAGCATAPPPTSRLPDGPPPQAVRMTWFGISNWTLQIGALNILVDGYMSRIPQDYFHGGGGGLAFTNAGWPIDRPAVDRALATLTVPPGRRIDLILTGHSHFDHSFDTPYWAERTRAPVVGSRTTCFQVEAFGVPASQCTVVNGGETMRLNAYVTMRVVQWNHSGTHATNPEQHDPVELDRVPERDAAGNLRGGVAEDFPNGGGNRGYLFTVRTASGRTLAFFVTNSGSPADLDVDTMVNGTERRDSPLSSLRHAMDDAGLSSIDLWIGSGGAPVAAMTVPLIHPKVYVPNHLGNYFDAVELGLTKPFNDQALIDFLGREQIGFVPPQQYFDAFVLDVDGFRAVDNVTMKSGYHF